MNNRPGWMCDFTNGRASSAALLPPGLFTILLVSKLIKVLS